MGETHYNGGLVEFEVRPDGKYLLTCKATGRHASYPASVKLVDALDLLAHTLPAYVTTVRVQPKDEAFRDALQQQLDDTSELKTLEGRVFKILR